LFADTVSHRLATKIALLLGTGACNPNGVSLANNRRSPLNFLHSEFEAGSDDVIEVTLDGQANVLLLDPSNFNSYKDGKSYRYHGGLANVSPVRLVPPHPGRWHVVVDLGGYAGSVRAGMRVLRHADSVR
jgi:hypothetical protein